jgi:hypothetical protein
MDFLLASFDAADDTGDLEQCCGTMMAYCDPTLTCLTCGLIRTVDEGYAPGAKAINGNTRIVVRHNGVSQRRWGAAAMGASEYAEEALKTIHEALGHPVLAVDKPESIKITNTSAELFSAALIHVGNVKQEKRNSLMAACVFYRAIACGLYLGRKELAEAFHLKVKGISGGEKLLQCWAMHRKIDLDLNINTIPAVSNTFCKKVGIPGYAKLCEAIVDYMIVNYIRPNAQSQTKVITAIVYIGLVYELQLDIGVLCKTKLSTFLTNVRALEGYLDAQGIQCPLDGARACLVFGASVQETEGSAKQEETIKGFPALTESDDGILESRAGSGDFDRSGDLGATQPC